MRGYFGIGIEGVSKPLNLGNLMRIAHAFDARFFFTVGAKVNLRDEQHSDTSSSSGHMPLYRFEGVDDFRLPQGCRLVGVEFTEEAVDLPRFHHPLRAAYVLGAERLSLSEAMLARCAYVVKIPTRFSINVGMAGAIVLYDRLLTLGGYGARPVSPGGPKKGENAPPPHEWGAPILRHREKIGR